MIRRRAVSAPRWLFYFAVGASWLFGAEIVVLTAAKRSLPGRLPIVAGWAFVAASAVFVIAVVRLEVTSRARAASLIDQLNEALGSITVLTETSLSSLPLDKLLNRLLERLAGVLRAEVGVIFLLADSQSDLNSIAHYGPIAVPAGELPVHVGEADGLVGRVVTTKAAYATNNPQDLDLIAKKIKRRLLSAAACPILIEDRLIGVYVVATSSLRSFGERELHLLQLVADRAGLGIERTRLDEAERRSRLDAERSRRHATVLAATSAALATAQDDYLPGFAHLVDIVVPEFSDYCAIDVPNSADSLQRLAVRAGEGWSMLPSDDPSRPAPDLEKACRRAFDSGDTQLSAGIWATVLQEGPVAGMAEVANGASCIVAPVRTTSGSVGTIAFAFVDREPRVGAAEVATAEDIARRATIAVERVLLYREAREAARRSSQVAAQLEQLIESSLAVPRLRGEADVLLAIAARALSVCDAESAFIEIMTPAGPLRSVAELGRSVEVGHPSATPMIIDPPVELFEVRSATRLANWLAAPVVGADGQRIGALATWRGIGSHFSDDDETILVLLAQMASTALANSELYRTIQSSEARWRTMIETAPIGIMEVDLAGEVQWANRAASAIFAPTSSVVSPSSELGVPKENLERLDLLWRSATGGVPAHDRELIGVRVGTESKDLLVSVAPLFSLDHSVHGVLTLVTDVTDRRRLENEIRQAQRMDAVSQLAGGVAHDFNNLLTLISGYAELLRVHSSLEERELDLVNRIQGVTQRASLLTGHLLTISRRQPSHPQVIAPTRAIESIMAVLGRILGDDIVILCNFDPAAKSVSIDAGHLDQMILNLAINARDAMANGGRLTLEIAPNYLGDESAAALGVAPGEYVRILVGDNGTGMDAETMGQCFDPFFTTKSPSKGTGLGLAAVRGVVTDCHGAIRVESELGRGTSFIIYLPAVESVDSEIASATSDREELVGSETVLVAEDDDALLDLLAEVLRRAGYRVLTASAGDVALEVATSSPIAIDMVVTDVAMPGMNGPDLAEQLSVLYPNLAIVFISSNTAGITVPDLALGRAAFLPKPFRPSQLLSKVREILDAQSKGMKVSGDDGPHPTESSRSSGALLDSQ